MRAFVFADGNWQSTTDAAVPVPEGAVEVDLDPTLTFPVWNGSALVEAATVATWYVDATGNRRSFQGDPSWTVAEGGFGDVPLAVLKAQLKAGIDDRAEILRLSLITPGSGQAMEYQEAYAQAVQAEAADAAGQAIKPGAFPMLEATAGIDVDPLTKQPATDVLGVARSVIAAYDAYGLAGAAIRGARIRGKKAVDDAADAAAARAAAAGVGWPALA